MSISNCTFPLFYLLGSIIFLLAISLNVYDKGYTTVNLLYFIAILFFVIGSYLYFRSCYENDNANANANDNNETKN